MRLISSRWNSIASVLADAAAIHAGMDDHAVLVFRDQPMTVTFPAYIRGVRASASLKRVERPTKLRRCVLYATAAAPVPSSAMNQLAISLPVTKIVSSRTSVVTLIRRSTGRTGSGRLCRQSDMLPRRNCGHAEQSVGPS